MHDASGFDLSREALQFLAALPTQWDAVLDGVRVAIRHARPKSDMDGIDALLAIGPEVRRWLAETEADVFVVGHTHEPDWPVPPQFRDAREVLCPSTDATGPRPLT